MPATPINSRDLLLQASTPRLTDPSSDSPTSTLVLSPARTILSYVANTSNPQTLDAGTAISITSSSTRSNTTYAWNVVGTPAGVSINTSSGASVSLTYTNTLAQDTITLQCDATSSLYSPSVVTKTVLFTKQLPALVTRTLQIYQRGLSAPALPTSTSYVFNTGVLTVNGGWSITVPGGTDPLYTSTVSVSTYSPLSAIALINSSATTTGYPWASPTLLVQNGTNGTNGTNGSDATVNMANLKTAIESGSSTTINIANHSTLFKSSASNDSGIFIGSGGLYGKSSGVTTFAINGTTGAASFKGDVETTGKGLFEGTTYAGSGSTVPVALYGKATTSSDVGVFGLIGRSSASATYSGVQGRVADPTTLGACSYTNVVAVLGTNYSDQSTSWAGQFLASGGGGALDASGGQIRFNTGTYTFSITSPTFNTGPSAPLTVAQLNYSLNTWATFSGTQPSIKLDRTSSTPFYIRHDYTNIVFSFGGTNNDLVLSTAGALTARDNITAYSDKHIKENILPLQHPLEKLKGLGGYQYKNRLANKNDCGIIAQEVEKILPQLVQTGSTEFDGVKLKTVNYNGIVALLVAAVNELQAKVERLEHGTTQ
jgi:hypothetical protein